MSREFELFQLKSNTYFLWSPSNTTYSNTTYSDTPTIMEGYTKKITPKGYTKYYFKGKTIAKKEVPAHVLDYLGGPQKGGSSRSKKSKIKKKQVKVRFDEPEIIGTDNEEGILYSSPVYRGYEFTYDEFAQRQFYNYGEKIREKDVPEKIMEVLNEVDDDLDFFYLVDQRVGGRKKKASLWLDIVKEDKNTFSKYYIYRQWEIPGDRIPIKMLSDAKIVDQKDADDYNAWKKAEKKRKRVIIEKFRKEQHEKARVALDERLNKEKEQKKKKIDTQQQAELKNKYGDLIEQHRDERYFHRKILDEIGVFSREELENWINKNDPEINPDITNDYLNQVIEAGMYFFD